MSCHTARVGTAVTISMRRVSVSLSYAFGKPPQQKAKRDPAADPQAAGSPSGPIH